MLWSGRISRRTFHIFSTTTTTTTRLTATVIIKEDRQDGWPPHTIYDVRENTFVQVLDPIKTDSVRFNQNVHTLYSSDCKVFFNVSIRMISETSLKPGSHFISQGTGYSGRSAPQAQEGAWQLALLQTSHHNCIMNFCESLIPIEYLTESFFEH